MKINDLEYVENGPKGAVALTKPVAAAFEDANAKARARISRAMLNFSELGPGRHLNQEVFRHEERVKLGHEQVAIFAFKGWQVRIYGGIEQINGKPTFVGTEIDKSKKQDKANRSLLRQAASKLLDLRGVKK
jgi:hypothetical protein